ncbi:AAA family ATPase [Parvibium lacunae]|uniref:ATPase n=1 Tax=Parvibium lacunae TaxID=1888893 RepID=A0A368KZJ2_9BURK|nr:AAA family ATPase [Parvibium lacunae]RCS56572.1 ATPase [Parvibium lacunae]
MYLDHFGLREHPFRITPHTDFFFSGAERGAILAALEYAALHEEGIIKVTGEVGSGKTMLCRMLLERLATQTTVVYLANPSLGRDEILAVIAQELGLEVGAQRPAALLRTLQAVLIERYSEGRRVVILVDEAHAMPLETLEEIRLLSNLESNRHRLLQIILFGQQELDENLSLPSMRQLLERITQQFHLQPLRRDTVGEYIAFRLQSAGYTGPRLFTPAAEKYLARYSLGLTRRVNILADKALLAAFAENQFQVTDKQVRLAVKDSGYQRRGWLKMTGASQPFRHWPLFCAGALLLVMGLSLGWWLRTQQPAMLTPPTVPTAKLPVNAAPAVPTAPAIPTKTDMPEVGTSKTGITPPPVAPAPAAAHLDTAVTAQLGPVLRTALAAGATWLGAATAGSAASDPSLNPAGYAVQIGLFRADRQHAVEAELVRIQQQLARANAGVGVLAYWQSPALDLATAGRLGLLFGPFSSREEAQQAIRRLPPEIRPALIQIRTRTGIHQEIADSRR